MLEVYNPQVMILAIFSIIYKSNDPQIFHLQKKFVALQIIHEAWRMLSDRLGACFGTILVVDSPTAYPVNGDHGNGHNP